MEALGTADILHLVTFTLAGEEYAIDILRVQEINRMVDITPVPNAPAFIEGVINLRGKVIPVINLRKKFGLEPKVPDGQSRIVVVDVGFTAGLVVDAVSEVLRLSAEMVEPPPPMAAGSASEFVRHVGKLKDKLVIILEIGKIVGNEVPEISSFS